MTTLKTTNPLLHNAITTESTKWGGNWGISGGKYGEFVCATCHSPNKVDLNNGTDFNIKRVKAAIVAPNSPVDNFPGSSVRFIDTNNPPAVAGTGFGDSYNFV